MSRSNMGVTRLPGALWGWQSLMERQVEKILSWNTWHVYCYNSLVEPFLQGKQQGGKKAAMQYYHDRWSYVSWSLQLEDWFTWLIHCSRAGALISTVRCSYNSSIQRSNPSLPSHPHIDLSVQYHSMVIWNILRCDLKHSRTVRVF